MPARSDNHHMPSTELLALAYAYAHHRSSDVDKATVRAMCSTFRGLARVAPASVRNLNQTHVENYLKTLPALNSKRRALSFIRGFGDWLVAKRHLRSNPTALIPSPKRPLTAPRSLPSTDITRLLHACPSPRERLITCLMVQECMRCVEVAGLEVGDIDMQRRVIGVRGKGGRGELTAHIPMSDQTYDAIDAYLSADPATAGPLIRSKTTSRALSPNTVSQIMVKIFKAAGIKTRPRDGKSAHALRHTGLTDMADAGVSIYALQRAARHKSLSSTQVYINGVTPDLREAMGGRTYG